MESNRLEDSGVLVRAHARMIHGFLLDHLSTGSDEPVVIAELEVDSARFGYQVIQQLARLCRRSGIKSERPFVYVMVADEERVRKWTSHPWLTSMISHGFLDFAQPDEGSAETIISLWRSGGKLVIEQSEAPVVVIARYLFSRTRRDVFSVASGVLYRLVPEVGQARVRPWEPVTDGSVYDRPGWNQLLAELVQRWSGPVGAAHTRSSFSVSPAALDWLERLSRMTRHGMLLCTDRGGSCITSVGDMSDSGALDADGEGDTTPVLDFYIMTEYALRIGGAVLTPDRPNSANTTVAFLYGDTQIPVGQTVRAYRSGDPELGSPGEFYELEPLIVESLPSARISQLCAYIRQSGWDDRAFVRCFPYLLARLQAEKTSCEEKLDIMSMSAQVWRRYFAEFASPGANEHTEMDDEPDVASALGMILFALNCFDEAMTLFEHSVEVHGARAATFYNRALCAAQLGQFERALAELDRVLEIDADFSAAHGIRMRIIGRM